LTRLVPDADIVEAAAALAGELSTGPTSSYARIKTLLWEAPTRSLAEHLDAEARAVAACAASPAGREGVAAFVARRPADFTALSAPAWS
jgi:2-(1,2-epoxy-1,2-dihydrophenyl)acetyl-CoA isomerase